MQQTSKSQWLNSIEVFFFLCEVESGIPGLWATFPMAIQGHRLPEGLDFSPPCSRWSQGTEPSWGGGAI